MEGWIELGGVDWWRGCLPHCFMALSAHFLVGSPIVKVVVVGRVVGVFVEGCGELRGG